MQNFNKLIDIKFVTQTKAFEIKTPRHGIKPQIEISGNLTSQDYVLNFEVRITNLYCDDIDDITDIIVTAGYEGNMSAGLAGKVQNMYTETPGPDKVTVFSCVTANYEAWLNKTIDLKLKEGFSLSDAIKQINAALEFETPIIDASVASLTCPAPLAVNGRCSEAISELKKAFQGVSIVPEGKKLRVYPTTAERQSATIHKLQLLTQAPQYSGGTVSVMAPWNPMVKPGDYIQFFNNFKKTSIGAVVTNTAYVNAVQFSFATCTDQNEMIITGVVTNQLEKEVK